MRAGAKGFPLIGIIATEATIWSKAYERAIHRRRHHARLLLRPTPLLAAMVEEGRDPERDPLVQLALRQYLAPMATHGADVLILGCTHYALLKGAIAQQLGERVKLIDSSQACAEDVARRLAAGSLLCGESRDGMLRCFVTDDCPRFRPIAARFLGYEPEPPVLVTPDQLYGLGEERVRMSA